MERYRIVKDVGLHYVTFTVIEWLVPRPKDICACMLVQVLAVFNCLVLGGQKRE